MTLQRNVFADTAKGIGILLMVYGHVARGVEKQGIRIAEPWYSCVDSFIYSFHMPLFFFLSGMFWLPSIARKGVADTAWSKVDTIAYPYVLWSLIQGGIELSMSQYTNGHVTAPQVLALWVPRAQFWFLFVLFAMFMLAALAYRVRWTWTTPVLLIGSVLVYLKGGLLPAMHQVALVSGTLVFFTLGIAFQQFDGHRLIDRRGKRIAWIAIFLLLQIGLHWTGWRASDPRGWVSLLVAAVSIMAIFAVSSDIKGPLRGALIYLGAATMPIYLMHVLFGSGTRILLSAGFGIRDTGLHLLAGTLVGVALPILVYSMRVPGKDYLFSAPISQLLRWSSPGKVKRADES